MSKTIFSVVIPAFNEEKFIAKTLESILEQDFKNFEFIVVDNNSVDRTAEIAKKFGASVFSEKNQGIAFARQKGFLAAKGEIIASTDADTILPKNWLSRIWEEFKKNKKLTAFGGSCYFYSGPISAKFASRFLLEPFLIFDKFFSGGWNLMGCNMAIKKEAFFKIGGFNTNLKLNEESEISHRLRKVGKVILDPNFKVKTSGRRYRHGLIFGLMSYAPSTIFRFLFKKYDKFQRLSPVRTEKSLINKFSFSILSFFIFLFFLFHFSTPKMVLARLNFVKNLSGQARQNFVPKNLGGQAKNLIKNDLNKTIFIERQIKTGIKNDFSKIKNFEIKRNGRNLFDI